MRYRNSTLETPHCGRVELVVLQVEIAVYNLPRTDNVGDKHAQKDIVSGLGFSTACTFNREMAARSNTGGDI